MLVMALVLEWTSTRTLRQEVDELCLLVRAADGVGPSRDCISQPGGVRGEGFR
jgi:hypothetical protein